jgi:lipid-binding SYLF domain-containing protein
MAYSVSNPPNLISMGPIASAANRPKIWSYSSVDAATTVDDSGYFTNGSDLGMNVGDLVIVLDNDTSTTMTLHRVTAVTAGGAATVSTTGLTVT